MHPVIQCAVDEILDLVFQPHVLAAQPSGRGELAGQHQLADCGPTQG